MSLKNSDSLQSRLPVATAVALMLAIAAPLSAHSAEAFRVVRDRETGELRAPNAAEIQALQKAEAELKNARSARGEATLSRPAGTEIRHADGTIERVLGDDDAMFSVATRNADGTTLMQCVPANEAKAIVEAPQKLAASRKAAGKAGYELK